MQAASPHEGALARLLRRVRGTSGGSGEGLRSALAGRRDADAPTRQAVAASDVPAFVFEPLKVPSAVRPVEEPHVLYLRIAAPVPGAAGRDSVVAIIPDAADVIRAEVAAAGHEGRPVTRAVLVGADAVMDPRAAAAEGHARALAVLVEAIRALVDARVPFVWRTRGGIDGGLPHALADVLVAAGPRAVVELGLPTLDAELCRALEGGPGVAPAHRVRLAAALTARGVTVRGLVDPLVPMLTDQQHTLTGLMEALAEAGVMRVGARYILLTRERARSLARRLDGMQRALVEGVFAEEPWHEAEPAAGARAVHKRIPAHLRRAGHHRIMDVGARHGILVDILDPVRPGEDVARLDNDAGAGRSEGRPRAHARGSRREHRRRPQLELFRATAPRDG